MASGHLKFGSLRRQCSITSAAVRVAPWTVDHKSLDRLTEKFVRNADDGDLHNHQDFCNNILDFLGTDPITAGLDHFALTLDDKNEALSIHSCQVPCMEFSIAKIFRRLWRVVPIPKGDVISRGYDLTNIIGTRTHG